MHIIIIIIIIIKNISFRISRVRKLCKLETTLDKTKQVATDEYIVYTEN